MREVFALLRHTPTEPRKDISTLLKRGLIILVTTIDIMLQSNTLLNKYTISGKWCTQHDSNVRPSPSEGDTLSS